MKVSYSQMVQTSERMMCVKPLSEYFFVFNPFAFFFPYNQGTGVGKKCASTKFKGKSSLVSALNPLMAKARLNCFASSKKKKDSRRKKKERNIIELRGSDNVASENFRDNCSKVGFTHVWWMRFSFLPRFFYPYFKYLDGSIFSINQTPSGRLRTPSPNKIHKFPLNRWCFQSKVLSKVLKTSISGCLLPGRGSTTLYPTPTPETPSNA